MHRILLLNVASIPFMKKYKQTLLWEVHGETLQGTSFVFGTMHVRDQRAFQRLEPVYAAITACEAFAAEFDLNDISAGENLEALGLPSGVTLDQLVPTKKYEKLRGILRKTVGIELDLLRHSQPILVANLIEESIMATDMPFSLDQHLWRYAHNQGKTMVGIETLLEQIQILRQIPLEHQIQSLQASGKNIALHRRSLQKMAKWYEEGDIQQLYKASRRGAHGLRKLLLYNRNELMAERISKMVGVQTTFCAIGAAHLAGLKGVLRFLKKRGFKINPVTLMP